MGTVFRYIADASLEAHRHRDLPCPLCESTDEVYSFYAEPEGGMISEACRKCIQSLPLDVIYEWDSEEDVTDHLQTVLSYPSESAELEAKRAAICAELRRTPRIPPFVQSDEWPLCCGDFVEYVGRPGLPEGWDGLGGLSLFCCPRCKQDFEIFQHT